ncbi:MAG: SGNH/GDSL hydrolase family protein [Candidatus Brocadiia bacterium]
MNRHSHLRWAPAGAIALALAALGGAAAAGEPCVLRGGETIAFFGDSITQNGGYVQYVDAFLATRFPDRQFRVLNLGISSETISGTSEADHHPRRPWAHERFARDVATCQPDIVVACFGMNDGNYHPFERVRFQKFRAGIRLLIERCRELEARLVLMTPPPFDPYRRRAGDRNAKDYGYKFPAIDYDHTLEVYSQWLLGLREEGFLVADVHSATNRHLRARRQEKVSFHLAPDAVHPDPTGHWLMAMCLLETLRAPSTVAEAEIDAAAKTVRSGAVANLAVSPDRGVAFAWTTPLPLPRDSRWDGESVALERVSARLSRYVLKVTGLPAERYRLEVDEAPVAEAAAADLAQGIDLNALEKLPANMAAAHVLGLVQRRRRTVYQAWRRGIATDQKGAGLAAIETAEKETADLAEKIRQLAQPKAWAIRLRPLEKGR